MKLWSSRSFMTMKPVLDRLATIEYELLGSVKIKKKSKKTHHLRNDL